MARPIENAFSRTLEIVTLSIAVGSWLWLTLVLTGMNHPLSGN